jgi:hypothetical protein
MAGSSGRVSSPLARPFPAQPELQRVSETVRAQFPHLQILPLDRQTGLPLPSSTREGVGDELAGLLGTDMVVTHTRNDQPRTSQSPLPGMIGGYAPMQRVYRMTQLVARRDTTVLILGQSEGRSQIWSFNRATLAPSTAIQYSSQTPD